MIRVLATIVALSLAPAGEDFEAIPFARIQQVTLLDCNHLLVVETSGKIDVVAIDRMTIVPGTLEVPASAIVTVITSTPASKVLDDSYVDARGMRRRVVSDCAGIDLAECVRSHELMLELMRRSNPPRVVGPAENGGSGDSGGGDSGIINLPGGR